MPSLENVKSRLKPNFRISETLARRSTRASPPYVDPSPAGDPTYDPFGTSRPFTPTHKRISRNLQISGPVVRGRKVSPAPNFGANAWTAKLVEALRDTISWRVGGKLDGRSAADVLRPLVYGTCGVAAGICVLVIGTSFLAANLLPKKGSPTPQYAAAQTESPNGITSETNVESATTTTTESLSGASKVITTPGNPVVTGMTTATMNLYMDAAKTCNMPWQILAAIGQVESNHGKSRQSGVTSGQNSAGARGPMQFLQSTWDVYGVDADGDGNADIYNQKDSVYSAAKYLCANGAQNSAQLDNALWNYNHSDEYVNLVRRTAVSYGYKGR